MRVAGLVVDERRLARRVLDVLCGDRAVGGRRSRSSTMLSAVRASPPERCAISSTTSSDASPPTSREPAPDDDGHLLRRQRLELVDLRARDERGVDLVVRVLGRRADQRQEAGLDAGQQRVLLRLVEAVDLVEEEDRAPARSCRAAPAPARAPRARPSPSPRRPTAPRRPRRSTRRRSARASSSRCRAGRRGSRSGRGPPRSRAAARSPRRGRAAWPTNSPSARRPQPLRERRDLARVLVRGVGEEVAHDRQYAPPRVRDVRRRIVERGELRAHGGDLRCDPRSRGRNAGDRARGARARRRVRDRRRGAASRACRRGRRRHRHLRRPAREGARAAAAEGLAIRFDEGDCQELPYGDAEFDAVASAFGAIFAPTTSVRRPSSPASAGRAAGWPSPPGRRTSGGR